MVIEALGDVDGQSLLHLQCHFGIDSLALARRGARVTGVDFSAAAITAARELAAELKLDARFVESDVYELTANLDGEFDIVFASHGALCWLPELAPWARVVAHFLKPGGRFCLVDAHPFALIFDERRTDGMLTLREPYFSGGQPLEEETSGSYADRNAPVSGVERVWLHTVEEILDSLLSAGLRIERFREYPYLVWPFFPQMELAEPGLWQLPGDRAPLPLSLAVTARK
jgi:SAM-dependent methyltransferase